MSIEDYSNTAKKQ